MRAAYRMLARGETTFDRAVSADDFETLDVLLPPMDEQRRIADFLDDRVARVDQIIAARKAQVELATSLPWAGFRHELQASAAQAVPLRRAIAYISDGPFGSAFTSDDYVEEGPAVIRLGNIGFAEFRSPDLARIPDSIYARFPRSAVRAGDLLIASLGDDRDHAGRACIAPAELGPAMVKGKCYVGRPSEVANAEFLALLLSSPLGAEQLVAQGSGATRSMLNFERLLSTVLPVPGRVVQEGLVADFAQARATSAQQTMRLQASIDLLAEYKQSLITAAVTGELDVTTAGSGIPG